MLHKRVFVPSLETAMVIIADPSTQFLKLSEAEKSASNPTHLFSIFYEEVACPNR